MRWNFSFASTDIPNQSCGGSLLSLEFYLKNRYVHLSISRFGYSISMSHRTVTMLCSLKGASQIRIHSNEREKKNEILTGN